MSNKKVGVIANTSWNIINFRGGLIQAIRDAGHEVIIIAPQDEYSEELEKLNFKIIYLQSLSRKGTNPLRDLALTFELAKIYRKQKLDIVLQYTIKPNIYGSIAGFLAHKKTVSTVTGLGFVFLNKGLSSTIAKWLYKIAFKFSHLVYFQNSDDKLLFEKEKLVSTRKSKLVNGSGIDTNYYHPDYCIGVSRKQNFTFLMIARLLIDKGVYEYIEAARIIREKYKDTQFLLLGDQDSGNPAAVEEEDIIKWKQEGIVDILGFKRNTRDYICQADVIVLPSYREGIPRVILESFAMGKPCITTDAPGCRHTVDDGINGWLCRVEDAQDLADKMEQAILQTEDERVAMGQEARKKAEEVYALNIIVQEYLRIIESNF